MKNMWIFIFIVLVIYASVNTYIIVRGWQLLELLGRYRYIYLAVALFGATAFFAGLVVKRMADTPWTDALWNVGAWWLVVFLYALVAALSFDLVRLVGLSFGKKLATLVVHWPQVKVGLFAAFTAGLAIIAGIGYYNGTRAKVRTLDIAVQKSVAGSGELNIVAVSDMHLGAIYARRHLQRWVTQINALQPDIVFLVGDTFDDNPAPVFRKKMGELFAQLRAPLGVYAVTGNHEMMGEPAASMHYLAQYGVQPLLDTAVLVGNRLYVVGRMDRSARERKSIAALMAPLNTTLPVIVLDHQPYEWDAIAAAGADISLSGHTHHGQLWPFNFVTQGMYEKDWGYLQKGRTHFYTSCGVGAWAAPVRTGSRSEIVRLRVSFKE
ncbi:MAG: metallophosphoesterase [Prevotellaceae bacterium]|jgi:predicted MPP superfamily phosphohydrolase|nr:metallophosphoesterase [Prevotellaceae bacterium]